MTEISGFVFDLDGVITDTAKYHFQAWQAVAQEALGITIDASVNELLKGRSRMDSLKAIVHFGGQDGQHSQAELAAIADTKNQCYRELIKNMTAADILPHMADFLREVQAHHYPMAVASASFNAPTIIDRIGLTDTLSHIVSPDSVAHGKLAPDIFEAAADLIDSPYPTTVGVEDAAAGIQGIKAAGMFAVGIGDAQLLHQADLVVADTTGMRLDKILAALPSALIRLT